ncbi:hypothetical protein RJ641_001342 [Dillenia turbinata]|uniref:WRKY19-like zinc finger domain-containing protein n=1 Tax=Dillenia turbinata TaxID=194707 RepID=A0AAN8WDL0_9MAGN
MLMDPRFQTFGFAANGFSNAFKSLGSSIQATGPGATHCIDTDLWLDSPILSAPYLSTSKGIKRKWFLVDGSAGHLEGSALSLGLGRSSSSSDSKGSSATACTSLSSAKETEEESAMDIELDFSLHLGNEKLHPKKLAGSNPKAADLHPKIDLELSLSTGHSESEISSVYPSSTVVQSGTQVQQMIGGMGVDEELTSSCQEMSISMPPKHVSLNKGSSFLFNHVPKMLSPTSTGPEPSSSIITVPKSSVTCTSRITQPQQPYQRSSSSKTCRFIGCGKGARGASGLCIAHGGGRRCQKLGCHKGAEGRTAFCKAHGGGRRCEFLGCTKSAEGRTDYCIAHGGGRRCSHEGCTRAARGKSGLCIRHGGGKRCQKENCTKSAEGLSGLCISHGGGRRCQFPQCAKGAQGSTMFCKAHGGGKRCTAPGCTKGAEGSTPFCKGHGGGKRCSFQGGGVCPKSVHGGTLFCVAHGGGKRCAMPDCTKSARGRTDYCVRHGGGKRCKFAGCGKSAQGSTDFCKAHGGGKRCSWGQPGSEFGSPLDGPCDKFARGKTGLCANHSAQVHDKRVHGAGFVGAVVQDPLLNEAEKMKGFMSTENMMVDTMNRGSSAGWGTPSMLSGTLPVCLGGFSSVPEGRVHGGSLMAMLAGQSSLNCNIANVSTSEQSKSHQMPLNWM